MVWTDAQRETAVNGGAAPVQLPGVEAPCVVVRQDVFERLKNGLDDSDDDFDKDNIADAEPEVWLREFDAMLKTFEPVTHFIDDSRETIYGDDRA